MNSIAIGICIGTNIPAAVTCLVTPIELSVVPILLSLCLIIERRRNDYVRYLQLLRRCIGFEPDQSRIRLIRNRMVTFQKDASNRH